MNALIPYLFETSPVRISMMGGDPWFVASDVCRILEIKDHHTAVRKLEEDERGVITMPTLGGPQELLVASESGLYALIFRSRKPAAVAFRKWVTSEVIPSIRKTGHYQAENQAVTVEQSEPVPLRDYVQVQVEAALWRDREERRLNTLRHRTRRDPILAVAGRAPFHILRFAAEGNSAEEIARTMNEPLVYVEGVLDGARQRLPDA